MQYMGGKVRIAKQILPIILEHRALGQWYVEPFVGGGNVIQNVSSPCIGYDINPHTISALRAIRDRVTELPKNSKQLTKELYDRFKRVSTDWRHGYIGFACSFGGKYYGGYVKDTLDERDGRVYPRIQMAYNSALRQSKLLQDVHLECLNYFDIVLPNKSIIYCDPPYEGTTPYHIGGFDHERFWDWCRIKTREGHKIFISEYNAPPDFECVWAKEQITTLQVVGSHTTVEKLFTYNLHL